MELMEVERENKCLGLPAKTADRLTLPGRQKSQNKKELKAQMTLDVYAPHLY